MIAFKGRSNARGWLDGKCEKKQIDQIKQSMLVTLWCGVWHDPILSLIS